MSEKKKKSKIILKKTVVALLILFLLSFIAAEGLILNAARTRDKAQVDYLVVLGAGLHGREPSPVLLDRLEKAVEYLDKNPALRVVVSGGQGPGEALPEAVAMKAWLMKRGISEDRILIEEESTSTMENFRYTMDLLRSIDESNSFRIMIITNGFHMLRAKMLAARVGFIPYGMSARTYVYAIPLCYTREYFALVKSYLIDR